MITKFREPASLSRWWVKPRISLQTRRCSGPAWTPTRGLALSMALHPTYGQIDAYHMTAASIDEAVRRLLAVGGRLEHVGGVDNFCWPSIQYDPVKNPDGRLKAAQLVRANWALKDYCLAYGIPLLSGKDSMYIDGHLAGEFGETHKVSGLPTLLFTATSIIPDVSRCLTLDLKAAGDYIYLVGRTRNELGGSEFYELFDYVGLNVPQVDSEELLKYYHHLRKSYRNRSAGLLPRRVPGGPGGASGHAGHGRRAGPGSGSGRCGRVAQ